MRLEQLQYLLEVSSTHSISIAAENLYLSQSTISESIKKLEDELKITLFTRTKSGMFLTEIGQEIANDALRITDIVDHIQQTAAQSLEKTMPLSGHLQLDLSISIVQSYLQETLPLFQEKYPYITLGILETSFEDLIVHIEDGTTDLSLTHCDNDRYWRDKSSSIVSKCLLTENFYVLVNKSSELANKKTISLKEISKYPLAALGFQHNNTTGNTTGYRFDLLFSKNLSFNMAFQTSNLQLFQDYILQHNAVGFIMNSSALKMLPPHEKITAIKISDKSFKARLYYLYRFDNPKVVLIEAFLNVLEKIISS